MMTTLALLLGAVVLYLLSTGGLGLSLDNLWPLTAPDESDTSATATPPAANAARPVNSGPRIVSYTVTATAGAAPGSVEVDYVDAGARPAHAQVTLPWQQEAQLAPGAVARLVAEGEAGQGFIARIYVAGELRAEAEAEPVAAAPGATPRWRAQVEAPLAP